MTSRTQCQRSSCSTRRAVSSNGTAVYYHVCTAYWPGGQAYVVASGTLNRPVLASYPAGTFNPSSSCDNVYVVGGCEPMPFSVIGPFLGEAGICDVVVTHCYNGDAGSYDLHMDAVLFADGFDEGTLGGWSTHVP